MKILFVDDEEQILRALKRVFRDTDYEVFTASSGQEGLALLDNEAIRMVVSDIRMPNMDGYEFLTQVKEKHPKVMRMILSGYADEKVVFRALQKNIAKNYMFKPWENNHLIKVISQMFETERLLSKSEIFQLISNIENVPTVKMSCKRIIDLIDKDYDIKMIATEIEKDAGIATNVLHLANSAFFGGKTGSLQTAITYLGLKNTRNLVLTTSIIESMNDFGLAGEFIQESWKHAFITNKLITYFYAKVLRKKMPESLESVGLLINVGKIFMLKYKKQEYLMLYRQAKKENLDIHEVERKHFGVTYNEIGGYLLSWWDFPYAIVETATYHTEPQNPNVIYRELVCVAHIAMAYAYKSIHTESFAQLYFSVFDILDITKDEFDKAFEAFIETDNESG